MGKEDIEYSPRNHKNKIEALYENVRFPEALDWWSAHYAEDTLDVAISNARHLDPKRQEIENHVWRRIVPSNGRVLDLGCGRGFFCNRLMEALELKVNIIGVDISETILKVASVEQKSSSFVCCDALRLPFSQSTFDIVLLITAIEQMEEPLLILQEADRILRNNGYLYLCIHKPYIDPLIGVPIVLLRFIRDRYNIFKSNKYPIKSKHEKFIGFKGALTELRRELKISVSNIGFELVESGALLNQMEWRIYKYINPVLIPPLIKFGSWLNRLPINYYKDLEYWLIRKP